jgi:4a-hydroxytetrahydrobiopterin dehydratase
MSEDSKERVYQPDEIEARLKRELPHWRYENGWIRRTFRTSGWKGTLMVINAVGHLAEAAWRPGKEGGALEGTPTGDQRFAYIKYDDK